MSDAAALAAGGSDFGAPGSCGRSTNILVTTARSVIDPDGHDIEAVFHGAP